MITEENTLYLLANAFRIYTYMKFFHVFFKEQRTSKWKEWIVYSTFFVINSFVFFRWHSTFLNLFSNLFFIYLIPFLYRRNIVFNIGIGTLGYAINIIADCALYFFASYSIVVQSGMATSLLFFFFTLILEFIFESRTFKSIRSINLLAIIIIPMGSILIAVLTMYEYKKEMLMISIILFAINIIVFYLFAILDTAYQKIHEAAMADQSAKAYMNQLDLVYQTQEQQRFLRHDMKNHLQKMQMLLQEHKYDELSEYISRSTQEVASPKDYVHSGNGDIDSFLNYKLAVAEKHGARISADVRIPDGLQIDSFDISVILGNLLDNAIEAITSEENPSLSVRIDFKRKILFITVQNTCTRNIKIKAGIPFSTKKGTNNHGIGLKSISHALQKYNGNMKITCDSGVFTVTVLMYIN